VSTRKSPSPLAGGSALGLLRRLHLHCSAQHGVRAGGDGVGEAGRGGRKVLRKETCDRDTASTVSPAFTDDGQRTARQIDAAGGKTEEAQIGLRAGKRGFRVLLQRPAEPARRHGEGIDGSAKPLAHAAELGPIGCLHFSDCLRQLGDVSLRDLAALKR